MRWKQKQKRCAENAKIPLGIFGAAPEAVLSAMADGFSLIAVATDTLLLGDSALNFRVLFWVHFDESLTVKSEIGLQIYDTLKESGIQIPVPLRMITMKSDSDASDDSESL